ncbi:MAG: hypothetical protein JWQ71_4818 [Pedosphaera sp.]|nr:hypothetical protein [Pedosphaera sp.]
MVCHRPGILHPGDIQILLTILFAGPARPDEIHFAVVRGKNGSVNGPTVGLQFTLAMIFAQRIVILRFQNPHAMILILSIIGCVIDVPFVSKPMQFRRPDRVRISARRRSGPDTNPWVLPDARDGPGFPDADAALWELAFAVVVKTFVMDHPRVCCISRQYRVNMSAFLLKFHFWTGIFSAHRSARKAGHVQVLVLVWVRLNRIA